MGDEIRPVARPPVLEPIARINGESHSTRRLRMAPRPELTRLVCNQSSRRGVKPTLIVLHSTESHNRPGLADLQGLGSYFDTPGASASSHVANDAEGNDARYVRDERKAWTQAYYNSQALSVEQVGHAAQTHWPDAQLRNTAAWVAYWSVEHDIPIRHSTKHGVCLHSELGQLGGGHHDPGEHYPLGRVLDIARDLATEPDWADRREAKWRRSLEIQRSRLKTILNGRARIRQEAYERYGKQNPDVSMQVDSFLKRSGRYRWTTRAMRSTRERIERLKRLIAR